MEGKGQVGWLRSFTWCRPSVPVPKTQGVGSWGGVGWCVSSSYSLKQLREEAFMFAGFDKEEIFSKELSDLSRFTQLVGSRPTRQAQGSLMPTPTLFPVP